ncbi:MAG: hypothetical protein Q9219_006395 [cf. Caloplaca sp. 3 TL-2023]
MMPPRASGAIPSTTLLPMMADQTAKEGEPAAKASSGTDTGVRKFTLSCSRCRASKLKCDKKEPCMECVRRNVGHLCTKDERQPRAKRVKTDSNNTNNKTKSNNSFPSQEIEAEEAAQALEHFVDGTCRNNAYPSNILEPTLPFAAPDYPNVYWLTSNGSQRQAEKFGLIREIIDAMYEQEIVRSLYEVFVTRCSSPLGNVVHTPSFMKQVDKFYGCLGLASPEASVMALSSTMSMDTLASLLLAVCTALDLFWAVY